MRSRARIVAAFLAEFTIVAVGFGCQSASKDGPPAASNEPPMEVSADELFAAYERDSQIANDRYRGKIVRVTGVVNGLDRGIILGKEAGVACMMKPGNTEKSQGLWLKDIATIKGVCRGPRDPKAKVLFVYVTDAELIDFKKAKN